MVVDPSANNVSCVDTDVSRDGAVSITKVDDFDEEDEEVHPLHPGDSYSYTLSVENTGTSTLREVTVTDTLPEGLTYVSAAGTDWSCGESSGVITCDLTYTLDPGDTADDIVVDVTIDDDFEGTEIENTADVDAVDQNTPAGHVIEAVEQPCERSS